VYRHFDFVTLDALRTIKYHGQNRERTAAVLCDADIVITTYHTLATENSNSTHLINDIEWYRLVLDEGAISLLPRDIISSK
jgi:SWI/SNF-related matrix-associated actin-dependent regulator of chromatin subfamily A3